MGFPIIPSEGAQVVVQLCAEVPMPNLIDIHELRPLRVRLPVRFVEDVNELAQLSGLDSVQLLVMQVEVTLGIVQRDEGARTLLPYELREVVALDEPWGTLDVLLRPKDIKGVLELAQEHDLPVGHVVAALSWHIIQCCIQVELEARERGIDREGAMKELFPHSIH